VYTIHRFNHTLTGTTASDLQLNCALFPLE